MMRLSPWLNAKRLRDYPRLMLVAGWAVLLLNFIFQHGWIGGITGIMLGGDFISNYSGGVLYRTEIGGLYHPDAQQENQASLIAPNQSPGFAPFISPPYVALTMSWLSFIPLPIAFAAWEVLNFICVVISAYLMTKYLLPAYISKTQLPAYQMLIIILSTFACVDGFLAGQSHGMILLLCTGIVVAMMKEKWPLAGVLCGFLLYKPQFVVGFVICWLIWRRWTALLSFGALAVLWQAPVIAVHGIQPYLDYLQFSRLLLYLPYAKEGFPIAVMSTPYALLATLLPASFARALQILLVVLALGMTGLLASMAYKSKDQPAGQRSLAYSMAILFPLVIAPHTNIYDLLILVPAMILLASARGLTTSLIFLCIALYIGLLFLPFIGYLLQLALPGLIPIALLIYVLNFYFRTKIAAAPS